MLWLVEQLVASIKWQPKSVAHPTDSRLYLKTIQILVRQAKRYGIVLRQSHTRWLSPRRCGRVVAHAR